MFRRILSCVLLSVILGICGLTTAAHARPYGYYSRWNRPRFVYVSRRPYYRPYYSVVLVREPRWRRHHHLLYVYRRPYYRSYRYW